MKVYIATKMEHDDDYKRPETKHTVVRVCCDKEKAYEFAHNNQLKYMRSEEYLADGKYHGENNSGLPTYSRSEKVKSWKVSYGKLIKLFSELLPEPEFSMKASQIRFLIKEHKAA
ncbi:hypothetical protein BGZ88_000375 [Linnemannia elongata]|nr:hypothetical protein BGZ88_000375 [Linnemannia elongata]